jgi:hypothetical protein
MPEPLTLGLLQGWLDIGAMVILSLLCFIWAGHSLLGFCLLTYTFISLISSGSRPTQQLFQPCSKPCSLYVTLLDTVLNSSLSDIMHQYSQRFAKLKELQSQHTKADTQFAAHLILPQRTQAHPPPQ